MRQDALAQHSLFSVIAGLDPIGAKIGSDVSRMRCSASDSEAVRRWSGTVAKAVCVTVPGLQRIIPLRSMLRSARDTRLSYRLWGQGRG